MLPDRRRWASALTIFISGRITKAGSVAGSATPGQCSTRAAMEYNVLFQTLAPGPIAVLRFQASQSELPTKIRWACGEVWNFLRAAQVKTAGRHVAIYHDGVINVECGAEVDEPFTSDGRVVVSATPAGRVATAATHRALPLTRRPAPQAIRKPVRARPLPGRPQLGNLRPLVRRSRATPHGCLLSVEVRQSEY